MSRSRPFWFLLLHHCNREMSSVDSPQQPLSSTGRRDTLGNEEEGCTDASLTPKLMRACNGICDWWRGSWLQWRCAVSVNINSLVTRLDAFGEWAQLVSSHWPDHTTPPWIRTSLPAIAQAWYTPPCSLVHEIMYIYGVDLDFIFVYLDIRGLGDSYNVE